MVIEKIARQQSRRRGRPLMTCGSLPAGPIPDALRASLSFHASFDKGLDADFARGDPKIYSAADYKQQSSAKAGLCDVDAVIEKGAGVRGGDALQFRSKNVRALFFRGDRHAALALERSRSGCALIRRRIRGPRGRSSVQSMRIPIFTSKPRLTDESHSSVSTMRWKPRLGFSCEDRYQVRSMILT
jgi:hypothetical protein